MVVVEVKEGMVVYLEAVEIIKPLKIKMGTPLVSHLISSRVIIAGDEMGVCPFHIFDGLNPLRLKHRRYMVCRSA